MDRDRLPQRRKIVHLISGLTVGGAEMMLYKLVSAMDADRFDNVVVALIPEGPVRHLLETSGIPVCTLGLRRGRPSPAAVLRLRALLKRERPDVLQTWMYHANLLGSIAGWTAGVPHVVWNIRCSDFIGQDYSRMTRWTSRAGAAISRLPDAAVINTRTGLGVHERMGYHPRRWEVIPNGFDLQRFRPDPAARHAIRAELGIAADALVVGHVARYDAMKDHSSFLQAAGTVLSRGAERDVHVVLAGKGVTTENAQLQRWLTGLPRERVHLLGERTDVPRLMAAFDVFVSSSAYGEGFSNVIGEAMASGVLCVVTDCGDSAEIVADTGRTVPVRDASALAAAIAEVLRLPVPRREALGQRARERVRQHYSLPSIVARYQDLYTSLTG